MISKKQYPAHLVGKKTNPFIQIYVQETLQRSLLIVLLCCSLGAEAKAGPQAAAARPADQASAAVDEVSAAVTGHPQAHRARRADPGG